MRRLFRRLRCRDRDEGQGLAEYSFILMLVAVACVGALSALGSAINTWPVWRMFD